MKALFTHEICKHVDSQGHTSMIQFYPDTTFVNCIWFKLTVIVTSYCSDELYVYDPWDL